MAETTPKMGLAAWDQPLDPYNFQQFSNNLNIIDFHDHTPGRGVQIPMGGIAPGAVGVTQLAANVPLLPVGSMILWGVTTSPAGFLLCDGSAYKIIDYAGLFAVIGTLYNNSPPTGYFNVPWVVMGPPAVGQLDWIIKT